MSSLSDAIEFFSGVTVYPRVVQLNNDNLFIAYVDVNDSSKGKFVIMTKGGTVIKAATQFAALVAGTNQEIFATLLNNGNVFIMYSTNTAGDFVVFDEDGGSIVSATEFRNDDVTNLGAVTLDNNNVFIKFVDDTGSDKELYFTIFTPAGVEVVADTLIATKGGNSFQIAKCSDGNVAISYASTDGSLAMRVYDQAGVSQLSETLITGSGAFAYTEAVAVGLANTNVLIAYKHNGAGSDDQGYFQIRTQAGASVVAEKEFHSGLVTSLSAALMSTQTFLTFLVGTGTGACNYVIIDQDGTISTTETEFTDSSFYTDAHALSSFQVVMVYDLSTDTSGKFKIFTGDFVFNTAILKKKLVAVSDNAVAYEDAAGSLTRVTASSSTLDTTKNIAAFEAYQKALIVNDTTFKILDFGNIELSTADIVGGGVVPTRSMLLTGGNSAAQMIVDFTTAKTSAALVYGRRITTATFVSGETITDTDTTVSFVLDANEVLPDTPHYYTWTPYANDTTTYGEMPTRATLGCLYRGRAVLSGNPDAPNQWYMSRQGNIFDWLYAVNDAQAPVAGNNADAGEIGDIVVALIAYKDDNLIFGCSTSMYILHGDPAAGGALDELSLVRGIFGEQSYCWDDKDNLYILDYTGLYIIPAGFAPPVNLSASSLPDLVKDWALDPTLHRVTLEYDRLREGILICKTTLATGVNENYWYSLKAEGYFPEVYPSQCGVYSSFYYSSLTLGNRDLLLGSADGFIRVFDETAKSDDIGSTNQAIDSYVTFGPKLTVSDIDTFGKLTSLSIVGAINSGDINCKLFVDHTAEGITTQLAASPLVPVVTTTITSFARPKKIRQRIRGTYIALQLRNSTIEESWSMETIVGQFQPAGNV